jgi:hypothetical protein
LQEIYHVTAELSLSEPEGIRGQIVQGYTTPVNTGEEVDAIEKDFVGSGKAKIWFENGGRIMCID